MLRITVLSTIVGLAQGAANASLLVGGVEAI